MSSKTKRTKAQRESAIRVDASADETFDTGTNGTSSVNSSTNTHVSVRQHEKDTLQGLNDRLAGYIERVRSLETENSRLQVQVREVETVERREKESLSVRYEAKIDELRKQLDYLTREKAKLQIENDKASSGYEDMRTRVPQLEKDLKKAEKDKMKAQADYQQISALMHNQDQQMNKLRDDNEKLKNELDYAEKQVDLLRRQLEDEVLLRTELENRMHTLRDDLEFSRRSHDNQMEEMTRKRQVEMTHYSQDIQNKYEAKLQEHLKAMRADFDLRMAEQRMEVENMYRSKQHSMEQNAQKYAEQAARARDEATMLGVRLRELENSTKDHQGIVDGLNRRVKELESQLRRAYDEADTRIQQRDEQIVQLRKEIADLINDYQDLLDLKVKLDTELEAYHRMLQEEENRLNITPSGESASPSTASTKSLNLSGPQTRSTPLMHSTPGTITETLTTSSTRRGVKRRRLNQEDVFSSDQTAKSWKSNSHTEGDVIIDEVDPDGKFIKVTNKGAEEAHIASWTLKSMAGDREISFKFHSRAKIPAGKSITVWSLNAEAEHQPPFNIKMKNQMWPQGDAIRTQLENNDQEVMAWHESILQHSFHGVEEGSDSDKACTIM